MGLGRWFCLLTCCILVSPMMASGFLIWLLLYLCIFDGDQLRAFVSAVRCGFHVRVHRMSGIMTAISKAREHA